MSRIPSISEAEWKVMKVLWARSPQRTSEIIEVLGPAQDWHPNTIKTLLSRLHRKKAVSITKEKNHYLFTAIVPEADCVQAESQSFMDRFFGGSVKPLLVHFVEKQKLSSSDIDELRLMLHRKKK